MAMLQHYYTSCLKGTSGNPGFQCKALSPGISAAELKIINSMINYRVPPALLEKPIQQHPPALRYQYLSPDRCILVCSQSNGTDDNGRPGNFFSHTVVTSPADFSFYPPIMFWRHPFWLLHDDSSSLEIPPEPSFNLEPSLETDRVWPFLSNGRRDLFKQLLSAVVLYGQTKRPILIIDDVDNVALWILALSLALPPFYRNLNTLTFSTFQPDPYQSPFVVTGITPDSGFYLQSSDYVTRFVLNTVENRVSDIPESEYANFVCRNMEPDRYERVLLDLFQMTEQLPGKRVANLEGRLQSITFFFRAVKEESLPIDDPKAAAGIKDYLGSLANADTLDDAQIDTLIGLSERLRVMVKKKLDVESISTYSSILRLLKKHASIGPEYKQKDLEILLSMILKGNEEPVQAMYALFTEIHSEGAIEQTLTAPQSQTMLKGYLSNALLSRVDVLYLFWKYILSVVANVNDITRGMCSWLLKKSLASLALLPTNDDRFPPQQAVPLLEEMATSLVDTPSLYRIDYLTLEKTEKVAFRWFYYTLVSPHRLSRRSDYRKLLGAPNRELLEYEIFRDVAQAPVKGVIPMLKEWVQQEDLRSIPPEEIISVHFTLRWKELSTNQKAELAGYAIQDDMVMDCLPKDMVGNIVRLYFPEDDFAELTTNRLHIYQKYYDNNYLSINQRGVVGGSIAMTTGTISENEKRNINNRLTTANKDDYQRNAYKFMKKFFTIPFDKETHRSLIEAVYIKDKEDLFWNVYGQMFRGILLSQNREKEIVALLNFWFDYEPQGNDRSYKDKVFFIGLVDVLREISQERDFLANARKVDALACREPWYKWVEPYFKPTGSQRKNFLGNLFHR